MQIRDAEIFVEMRSSLTFSELYLLVAAWLSRMYTVCGFAVKSSFLIKTANSSCSHSCKTKFQTVSFSHVNCFPMYH